MSNVELILPALHEKQKEIFRSKEHKFTIICCGTKFGKTLALAIKATDMLFNSEFPIQVLWAAPYFANARVGYKYLLNLIHPDLRDQNNTALTITLKHNGATIFFRGVNHDPESIEGEMYHHVIIDEASKCHPQGIVSIRTTTTATKARIDIVSTPRGKNWFYDYFKKGLDPNEPDYVSYTYPTSANPYISRDEIEIARRQLSSKLFEQYYLAKFVDGAALFNGYQKCIVGERLKFLTRERQFWYDKGIKDKRVVIGVDWAKTTDYTVFIAIDYEAAKPKIVAFMRFKELRYTHAMRYLQVFAKKFKETTAVYHDRTGVGEALDDMMANTGLPYEGITFTNKSKSEMVNNLMIAVEQQFVEFPRWQELLDEMENFEVKVSHVGTMRFEAANGKHDDIIAAFMLAWSAVSDYSSQDYEVRSIETLDEKEVEEVDEEGLLSEIEQFEAFNSLDI